MMRRVAVTTAFLLGAVALPALAVAKEPTASATKGAVAGGIAGHMMGHHTKTGAVAGAMIGHHMKKKQERSAG